jgi:hypothetical protein
MGNMHGLDRKDAGGNSTGGIALAGKNIDGATGK